MFLDQTGAVGETDDVGEGKHGSRFRRMDMPVMYVGHVGMVMFFPGMLMKMRVFHLG